MNVQLSDGIRTLHRYDAFDFGPIAARFVDVWLPPGYDDPAARQTGIARPRYPVLYMHDGQNLFDPALAYGGVDWGIDQAVTRLIQRGLTPGVIVVGIWNSARRWRDYMPQQALVEAASPPASAQAGAAVTASAQPALSLYDRFVQEQGGAPLADAYLRFLVTQVKPFVDAAYRTLPDQAHTFVMGSSMGGLISLYALTSYPAVFGGAGCLSTHWPAAGEALLRYFAAVLPKPGAHRIYFDYGTATLDALYEPYQQRMDAIMRAAGYTADQDSMTRKFAGAEHSETAWRVRVDLPLAFLIAGAKAAADLSPTG